MKRFILPLLLIAAFASESSAQYGEQLYASIESKENYIGCSAYSELYASAESSARMARTESKSASASNAGLRLINQSYSVQALVNSTARKAGTDYRISRTVDPAMGWEFVAELDQVFGDGPIAINDDNPLPGRVVYKLESRQADSEWETVDIRVVNRPLGMHLDDIDFLTAPFGALILPQTMLPQSEYTVEIFDLQGGKLESSHVRYGHKLKVHTAHLPFGVYEVVVSGERSRVSKFFLAAGGQ